MWNQLCEAPVRTVQHLLALEGHAAILGKPWARTFKDGNLKVPIELATTIQFFAEFDAAKFTSLLQRSGFNRIYIGPKNESGAPHDKWKVIWVTGNIEQVEAQAASLSGGLVKGKKSLGIRVETCAFEQVWRILKPNVDLPDTRNTSKLFKVQPLPHGTDKTALQKWSDDIKWELKPIRAIGARTWLLGANENPPTVLVFNGQPLIAEESKQLGEQSWQDQNTFPLQGLIKPQMRDCRQNHVILFELVNLFQIHGAHIQDKRLSQKLPSQLFRQKLREQLISHQVQLGLNFSSRRRGFKQLSKHCSNSKGRNKSFKKQLMESFQRWRHKSISRTMIRFKQLPHCRIRKGRCMIHWHKHFRNKIRESVMLLMICDNFFSHNNVGRKGQVMIKKMNLTCEKNAKQAQMQFAFSVTFTPIWIISFRFDLERSAFDMIEVHHTPFHSCRGGTTSIRKISLHMLPKVSLRSFNPKFAKVPWNRSEDFLQMDEIQHGVTLFTTRKLPAMTGYLNLTLAPYFLRYDQTTFEKQHLRSFWEIVSEFGLTLFWKRRSVFQLRGEKIQHRKLKVCVKHSFVSQFDLRFFLITSYYHVAEFALWRLSLKNPSNFLRGALERRISWG